MDLSSGFYGALVSTPNLSPLLLFLYELLCMEMEQISSHAHLTRPNRAAADGGGRCRRCQMHIPPVTCQGCRLPEGSLTALLSPSAHSLLHTIIRHSSPANSLGSLPSPSPHCPSLPLHTPPSPLSPSPLSDRLLLVPPQERM